MSRKFFMSASEIVSTALILFGILLGPAIFFTTIIVYGVKRALCLWTEYQQRCYVRSLPCSTCHYFTDGEFIQCAVNPLEVLTEDARSCQDFAAIAPCNSTNDYDSYLEAQQPRSSNPRTSPKSAPRTSKYVQ